MLAAVSPLIPFVLRWREQTARLDTLTRQVFWTYAGYILVINLCFGGLGTSNKAAWFTTSSGNAGCGPDTRGACLPAGLCRQSRLAANGNAVAFHDDNQKYRPRLSLDAAVTPLYNVIERTIDRIDLGPLQLVSIRATSHI